jgi:hypothetical protein
MVKKHKVLLAFVAGWLVSMIFSPKMLGGFFGRKRSA